MNRGVVSDLIKTLDSAVERNTVELEHRNVRKDGGSEDWMSGVFTFTRCVKGNPLLATLPVRSVLRLINEEWLIPRYGTAEKGWQAELGVSRTEGEAEFVHVWEAAKYAIDESPVYTALREAREHPVEVANAPTEQHALFVNLARNLQALVGAPFFLPCRLLSELLHVSAQTVSRYRRWAEKAGYLVVMKKNTMQDATEYKFVERPSSTLPPMPSFSSAEGDP